MTGIKGIVFDKDGTLFDFATTWEAWAYSFLMRLSGGDAGRAVQIGKTIGFDLERQKFANDSVVIAGTPDEIAQALHPFYPGLSMDELLIILNDEAEKVPQQQAVPLVPLLGGLRSQGLRLGVATNDTEKPARVHLDQAGVTEFFDFVVGYDSGFGGKPAPGQLLAFAAHVALDPADVVMVGDSTHDLHAGRAAGMKTFGVLTGLAEEAELSPFADAVFPDIGHLPGWLVAQGG